MPSFRPHSRTRYLIRSIVVDLSFSHSFFRRMGTRCHHLTFSILDLQTVWSLARSTRRRKPGETDLLM